MEFFRKVEQRARVVEMTEPELLRALPRLFKGDLSNYYERKAQHLTTWAEIKATLMSTFFPYEEEKALKEEIKNRYQKPFESITTYIAWIYAQNDKLTNPLPEEELVDAVSSYCADELQAAFGIHQFSTLDELESYCRLIENRVATRRKTRAVRGRDLELYAQPALDIAMVPVVTPKLATLPEVPSEFEEIDRSTVSPLRSNNTTTQTGSQEPAQNETRPNTISYQGGQGGYNQNSASNQGGNGPSCQGNQCEQPAYNGNNN